MIFLADVGISPTVVRYLRANGHEAKHLFKEHLERLPDSQILDKARVERAILLTHDLDFGELMAVSKEALPSVIIFRLPDMRPVNVIRHLQAIINQYPVVLGKGATLSVNERRVRVRSLPMR